MYLAMLPCNSGNNYGNLDTILVSVGGLIFPSYSFKCLHNGISSTQITKKSWRWPGA